MPILRAHDEKTSLTWSVWMRLASGRAFLLSRINLRPGIFADSTHESKNQPWTWSRRWLAAFRRRTMIYSWGGETVHRRFVYACAHQMQRVTLLFTWPFVLDLHKPSLASWSSLLAVLSRALSCVNIAPEKKYFQFPREDISISSLFILHQRLVTPIQALAVRCGYKWMTLVITGFDRAELQTTCEQRSAHLLRHAAGADLTVRTPTIAVRASRPTVRRHHRRHRAGLGGWRRRIDRLATVWWWRRRRWRRRKRCRSGLQYSGIEVS